MSSNGFEETWRTSIYLNNYGWASFQNVSRSTADVAENFRLWTSSSLKAEVSLSSEIMFGKTREDNQQTFIHPHTTLWLEVVRKPGLGCQAM
jgi:hypothetical protein